MLFGRPRRGVALYLILLAFSALCLLAFASPDFAQNRDLVATPVSPGSRVSLTGHHPLWASTQNDLGAVPADLSIGQLELILARSPQQQQAFEQFLEEQMDPASPNYHHWLTPVEIGERFGASQHDIGAITDWLQSQNLHVDSIANSRVRISFSGPASAIAVAFGAEMHYFQVNGEQRLSIAADPQIPVALADIIKSISGLYTVKFHPNLGSSTVWVPAGNLDRGSGSTVAPEFTTSSGFHYIFPSDFATIYDLPPTGTFNGAGQTIAVIGQSRVYAQDITNFETESGLAQEIPFVIVPPNGADPGPPETSPPTSGGASDDQAEATLDVTRAISTAPGATIDLVISSPASGGIVTAIEYVVDTNPVPAQIMTISFGGCESDVGQNGTDEWDSVFSQAAMEAISVFVASGDAGAAGCDVAFSPPPASQSLSINVLCSSSYVTCVGGTEFADSSNPMQYWATTNNSATHESALTYIPEGAWNEPGGASSPVAAASGGGVSAYIPTPPWQTGTGVPGNQGRYTPDVSFSSANHDGYFGCFAAGNGSCVVQNGSFAFLAFSGTSVATPSMAGITALLNQKYGVQGELNMNLYKLAATPANNVFHDVTVASSAVSNCDVTVPSMCNNSTPGPINQSNGLSGYEVGVGYDEATGLGSIDVANLLTNWGQGATTTLTSLPNPSVGGQSVTFTVTVASSASGTPTGTVTFLDNSSVVLGAATLNNNGVTTFTTSSLSIASHSITASYGGDTNHAASISAPLMQSVLIAAIAPPQEPIPVPAGQTVMIPLTLYAAAGSNLSFPLSCAGVGPATKTSCTFSLSPVSPGAPPTGTTVQLTFGTASSGLPVRPPNQDPQPFGLIGISAVLATALATGILRFVKAPRLRLAFGVGLATLSLAVVMAGCAGSSGSDASSSYTGTPKGLMTFTVTGTSGGTTVSTAVTITVQ